MRTCFCVFVCSPINIIIINIANIYCCARNGFITECFNYLSKEFDIIDELKNFICKFRANEMMVRRPQKKGLLHERFVGANFVCNNHQELFIRQSFVAYKLNLVIYPSIPAAQ